MRSARFLLLLASIILLTMVSLALSTSALDDPPTSGDWNIDQHVDYIGKTGYVEGSLNVFSNGQLTLEDSTLVINHSLNVGSFGTLLMTNSTIKFKGSLAFQSRFDVMNWATVIIKDTDNNRLTIQDASVITSDTSINYQWLVMDNATFSVSNSFISKCGLYSAGPIMDAGLRILANHAVIEGTNITEGYYGVIAEDIEDLKVENTTISDCQNGMILMGIRDTVVATSRIINNRDYGLQIQGFNGNVRVFENEMYGNGLVNFQIPFSSGFANELNLCKVGPGGGTGVSITEATDWEIRNLQIIQCQVGLEIDMSALVFINTSVSDCPTGVIVKGDGFIRLIDLKLERTTITVETEPTVNITSEGSASWTEVDANLACFLEAKEDGTFEMESCQISFENKGTTPVGIRANRRGTMYIYNSTLSSPVSGEWIAHMDDGSKAEIKWTTLTDLGTMSTGPREQGLFIGGGGTLEELTITDSLVGLVIGRANANFLNITIMNSAIGIVTDGNLGRGGAAMDGVVIDGCDVAIMAKNAGILSVTGGVIQIGNGEGLNMTRGTVTLTDSWMSSPTTGGTTGILRDLSTLNLVNSVTNQDFDIGSNQCTVNIYWYLNLTLRYLSNDSPLPQGLVTVKEVSGTVVHSDLEAGIDGVLRKITMREKSLIPNTIIMTPHTVTVSKEGLEDSFTILMDGSKDHTFSMDNYPPLLIVEYPEDGALLNRSEVTFLGQAWDAVITETEGLASMNYRVDGGDWIPIELPAVKDWTFDMTLDDGFHAVEVEVYDNIGNHNSSIVTVDVSTKLPSLILLSPEEGLITNQTALLVIGHTDTGLDVKVNGMEVNVSGDGSFNMTFTLAEGLNVIIVTATDTSENTAIETRNITLDTIDPEVVLDDPGPYVTNEPTYTLSGSKEVNATIYVNGYLHEFLDSDRFTTTIDLEEGLNPVQIFSVDLAGNNWSKTVIIERDSTPPSLSVARLPEFTNKVTITVQGSTNDLDAIITVNGEEVTLSGLTFAHLVTLAEGENTITVEAEDLLGNAAEPDVQVVNLDVVPPPLDIHTPKYVTTIDDEQNLSGETEPGLPVVVTVSYGGAYTKNYNLIADAEGYFEVTVDLPQIGNHSVTVKITDLAGNTATEDLYFERIRPDVEPPPAPEEPSWFEENWALVILLAAVIGAGAVLLFTFSSVKQRKEAMRARAEARMEAQRQLKEEESLDDEEVDDEDWEEEEVGDEDGDEEDLEEAEDDDEEDEADEDREEDEETSEEVEDRS